MRRLIHRLIPTVAAGLLLCAVAGVGWVLGLAASQSKLFYRLNLLVYTPVCLAACRRERTSSHASHSGSACVVQGTGTRTRTACGRKRNRVSDSD